MQRDDVRLGQQRIQRHIVRDRAALIRLCPAVREHPHPHRAGDAPHLPPNAAKADDAHRHSVQFDQRRIPEAEIRARRPAPGLHCLGMVADVHADLKQQRDGKLRDRRRPIGRDVRHCNALLRSIGAVDHVIARRHDRDEPQRRTGVDHLPRDRRFVDHNDLRVADALHNLRYIRVVRPVVDRQLSQRRQRVPAQITRILTISVQNHDLHAILLRLF